MSLPKGNRLALKLQLVSWFLYNDNIGGHIANINRFVDVESDEIVLKPVELSEFYRERFVNGSVNKWANSLVEFLSPKLSRLVFDLAENSQFFTLRIDYEKRSIRKTIMVGKGV